MSLVSKKIHSYLRSDHVTLFSSWLDSLDGSFDPFKATLSGEPFFIRLVQSGATQCLELFIQKYAQLMPRLWRQADSFGQYAIHYAVPYASLETLQQWQKSDPTLMSSMDDNGIYPYQIALSAGLWDQGVWLAEQCPPGAMSSCLLDGTPPLHLMAEPRESFELQFNRSWEPPQEHHIHALLNLGASMEQLNGFGYSAIYRSISNPHNPLTSILFQKIIQHPEPQIFLKKQGESSFSLTHLCVWHGRADLLESLLKLGADVQEETTRWSTLLHLSIKKNHPDCADLLFKYGFKAQRTHSFELPYSHAAISSTQPSFWLNYLKQKNILVFERDAHGHSTLEYAFEHLSFNESESLFHLSSSSDRQRAHCNSLGLLERACRSYSDVREKIEFLISQGILPEVAQQHTTNTKSSSQANLSLQPRHTNLPTDAFHPQHHFQTLPFYYQTQSSDSPLTWSPTLPIEPLDFELGFSPPSSPQKIHYSAQHRPSLLAFCVAGQHLEALRTLIELDQTHQPSLFSPLDYRMAWMVALHGNATQAILHTLALGSSCPSDWPTHALRGFGLGTKKNQLALFNPLPSFESFIQSLPTDHLSRSNLLTSFFKFHSKMDVFNEGTSLLQAQFLDLFQLPSFFNDRSNQCLIDPLTFSSHRNNFSLVVPCSEHAPWALHRSLFLRSDAPFYEWVLQHVLEYAQHSPQGSPWHHYLKNHSTPEPTHLLFLLDQQSQWLIGQDPVLSAQEKRNLQNKIQQSGSFSHLMASFLKQEAWTVLSSITESLSKLSDRFSLTLYPEVLHPVISQKTLELTSFKTHNPESLSHLRDFVDAWLDLSGMEDYLKKEDTPVILHTLPDASILQSFIDHGARTSSLTPLTNPTSTSSSHDPFSILVSRYYSRLSPSFISKLTELSSLNENQGLQSVCHLLQSNTDTPSSYMLDRFRRAMPNDRPVSEWDYFHQQKKDPLFLTLSKGASFWPLFPEYCLKAPSSHLEKHFISLYACFMWSAAHELSHSLKQNLGIFSNLHRSSCDGDEIDSQTQVIFSPSSHDWSFLSSYLQQSPCDRHQRLFQHLLSTSSSWKSFQCVHDWFTQHPLWSSFTSHNFQDQLKLPSFVSLPQHHGPALVLFSLFAHEHHWPLPLIHQSHLDFNTDRLFSSFFTQENSNKAPDHLWVPFHLPYLMPPGSYRKDSLDPSHQKALEDLFSFSDLFWKSSLKAEFLTPSSVIETLPTHSILPSCIRSTLESRMIEDVILQPLDLEPNSSGPKIKRL